MSAIFWKEFRENLAWAGVILLAVSGALVVGLESQFGMGMSILGTTFLTLCILVFPVAGLGLGMVQVFKDSRKGKWQFITHRRMSLKQFLLGKWLAGVVLYLLATGIPVFAVIGWVAMPGHVPGPFAWDMTEPVVAHWLSGLMWYFGGFLVAGRSARWIGSRVIPIGGALAGAFAYQLMAITFFECLVVIAIFTLFMAVTAWGNFGGKIRSRWFGVPTGFSLSIGWLFFIGAGAGLGETIREMVSRGEQYPYRIYQMNMDGEPEILTYNQGRLTKAEDLAGHEIPDPDQALINRARVAFTPLYFPRDDVNGGFFARRFAQTNFLKPEAHLSWISINGEINWFCVERERTIEGFDARRFQYIGSIGPSGFAGPERTPERFEEGVSNNTFYRMHSTVLNSPKHVYQLDLNQRQVRMVYACPAGERIRAMGQESSSESGNWPLVVATQTAIHIVDGDRPVLNVPIETNLIREDAEVGRTASGKFVIAYGLNHNFRSGETVVSVYNADGARVSRRVLPELVQPLYERRKDWLGEIAALGLFPQGFFAVVFILRQRVGVKVPWEAYEVLCVASAVWGAVMWVLLVRRHASRGQFFTWLPMAVLLGLPGVLVMVSMLKSERAVRCLKCGKRRFLSESDCRSCKTVAPGPAMEGIEIFAMG